MPTILIAEDSDELREMLRALLASSGYLVLEAADGQEAVEVAFRERPHLIIMDLGMPGMDGLSAVAEIRREVSAAETPILIVSAYDRIEFRTEAVSAGCGGFITKPIDPRTLLKTVKLLLREEDGEASLI